MGGWGQERLTPEQVRGARFRQCEADYEAALRVESRVVGEYLERPTTGNHERLVDAHRSVVAAHRHLALLSPQLRRRGW